MSVSLIFSQIILVISSPSISTIGFVAATLVAVVPSIIYENNIFFKTDCTFQLDNKTSEDYLPIILGQARLMKIEHPII